MLTQTEELRIETSTLCDYNCLFCPRDSFTRKRGVMDNDTFMTILGRVRTELPGVRYCSITGYGEPALDRDWRDKIIAASSYFSRVHTITNLSHFDYTDLEVLLRHVTDIRISAYAMSEESYRRLHRPPSGVTFESIRKKILWLLDHRRNETQVILNFIETKENRHERDDWISFWLGRADLLEVWRPHNWISGRAYRERCAHRESSCPRPFSGPVQVLVDGRVQLCCFDYNGELVIGNAVTESLHDIYNGEAMRRIQSLHSRGLSDEIGQCRLCDQRNCLTCRGMELIFNSRFSTGERLCATSADFSRRGIS